jgi:single-strand DNA-binding protein
MVGVTGELRQDRWEQDGQNRSRVEIVAANIQLIGSGGSGSGAPGGGYGERRDDGYADRPGRDAPPQGGDDGFTDDIPF